MNSVFRGLSWVGGILMLISALGALPNSFLAAFIFLLAACLLIPPIRSYTYSKTQKRLSVGYRSLAIVISIIVATTLVGQNSNQRGESSPRVAEQASVPVQNNEQTAKDHTEQTNALLIQLKDMAANDLKGRRAIYKELVNLDPRPDYIEKVAALDLQMKDLEERENLGTIWEYQESTDELTRQRSKSAMVNSTNVLEFEFPYSGKQRGQLTVRTHPRYGQDVIISVTKGQFLCGVESCLINVRFDEGNIQQYAVSEPDDHSTTSLFIQNRAQFLANVRRSKTVRIEAQFFQSGTRVLEFAVDGLKWN